MLQTIRLCTTHLLCLLTDLSVIELISVVEPVIWRVCINSAVLWVHVTLFTQSVCSEPENFA